MKKHDRIALLRQLDGAYTLPMRTFIERASGLDDGLDVLLPEGIEPAADTPVLLIPGEDMTHDRTGRRFVMVVNRFCWDQPPLSGVKSDAGAPVCERRLCGIQFHGVERVRAAGMPPSRRGMLFNLLAITATGSANATQLELLFSDNVSLRLDVDSLLILAEDLGDGHPTTNLPSHIDGS